ncbi:MAG: ribosome assembly cofactor RimP [Bacteroidota bacterium]|jgi:ribosome maturation factor RimP
MKGTKVPFIFEMNPIEKLKSAVNEYLSNKELVLINLQVSGGKIAIALDALTGVRIEDCAGLSRHLHQVLDETNLFEQYELEVGSPGMDEPLLHPMQFQKRLNHLVDVITFDGLKRTGKLIHADDASLSLEITSSRKINKKKVIEMNTINLSFKDIKQTTVNFSYDKLLK